MRVFSVEGSLESGGAGDFCGKRTKLNLEQHRPLIGVRMRKTRPCSFCSRVVRRAEGDPGKRGIKDSNEGTETSVQTCKSQRQVVSGKESSHFHAVVGETPDFTWIQSFIIEYFPSL